MDLNDAFYFVQVVEKGGFSAAARTLGIPKSRLSRRVRQLEDDLGVRLLQRTSRVVTPTELGAEYFRHAQEALSRFDDAETAMRRKANNIEGTVTVSCSVGMAQFGLDQVLPRFLQENPGVSVVQRASNQMEDLIKGGIDVAIRGHLDTLPDSSLIQTRLAQVEWHLFCAPDYRKGQSLSDDPSALAGQPALVLGRPREMHQWLLSDISGQTASVPCHVRLASDDMTTLKRAAALSLGIVALPSYVCRHEVEDGTLVRLLPGWTAGQPQISLIMPSKRGLLPAFEAFLGHLKQELPAVLSA
ncbi:LysR family transcriptional regulator [Actibacterium mucosum KCTC 23349]|uniref:LysR family transcriptional regulator n=1 Tax=Actibacterium mucosum KCTC 23349 TaxID=1454373 RepID=A0A037ZHS4_9RHOB|nr:LysR substrate-binding domain-containing protein [Actibacterium mucosum]KAJ54345.1 LysR family transcriptional regulator [Actibacterium mucosum KCTC 23349]